MFLSLFLIPFFLPKATTDLDIREASFNNESKELEESHKEEVEQLIGKNEALSQRIGELSEKMARQTAECDSKLDEMFKAVLRIQIHMFLGIPDPDPLVRGVDPDPDPSIIMQK